MKYFFDTEFIEGFSKWTFAKNRHFIDLISIGIISEDGRKYYAISNEFNPDDADKWVKENVLYPIMRENGYPKSLSNLHGCLSYRKSAIREVQRRVGKSNKQIANEIHLFINPHINDKKGDYFYEKLEDKYYKEIHNTTLFDSDDKCPFAIFRNNPEFYGYYADYDWVLFCSLFGRMIDLPKGFPMYCKDLKQMLDEKVSSLSNSDFFTKFHIKEEMSLAEKLSEIKKHTQYPQQENEHNALDDANWNLKLYNFINNINQ